MVRASECNIADIINKIRLAVCLFPFQLREYAQRFGNVLAAESCLGIPFFIYTEPAVLCRNCEDLTGRRNINVCVIRIERGCGEPDGVDIV